MNVRTKTTFGLENYLMQPFPTAARDDTLHAAYALFGSLSSQSNHYYRPCLRNLVMRFHEYLFLLKDLLHERKIEVALVSKWEDMFTQPIAVHETGLTSHATIDAVKKFLLGDGLKKGYLKKRADFMTDLTTCTAAVGGEAPEGIVYADDVVQKMMNILIYDGYKRAVCNVGCLVALISDEMFNFSYWLRNLLHKLGYGQPSTLKITRLEMEVRALKAAIQRMGGKVVVPPPPVNPGPLGPSDADPHEDWDDYRLGQNVDFNNLQDLLGALHLYKKRYPEAAIYERKAKFCYSHQFSKAGALALFQAFLDAVGLVVESEEFYDALSEPEEEFFDAQDAFDPEVSVGQNDNDSNESDRVVPNTEPRVEDRGDVKLVFDSEEVLVQELIDQPRPFVHPNMAVVHSSRFDIPLQAVRGSHLASFALSEIKNGNGPFIEELKRCNYTTGHFYVTAKCSMTIAAGCCIAIVYCESGHSPVDVGEMRRLLLQPHRLWNPACETAVKFDFQPWACTSHFHVDFMDTGTVYFVMVSGWSPAPHNAPSVAWSVGFSPTAYVHQAPVDVLNLPRELKYKSYLGTMSFSPLDTNVRIVEANLGKPCVVAGSGYGYGIWQSLLGCYAYWVGDVVLDLARGSSPMIGALVGVAVIPNSQAHDAQSLSTYPHVEVEFGPGRTVKRVLLPSHLFRHGVSSERQGLHNFRDESHTLAIWPIHYTSSSMGDPFVLTAVIVGVMNLSASGFSPGYVMTKNRLAPQVRAVYNTDQDYYEVSEGQDDDWHLLASGAPKKASYVQFFPPSTDLMARTSSLTKLLYTSCWVKGSFIGKLVWSSAGTISRSDWKSVLSARVYLGQGSHISNHMASSEPSGEWHFEFDIHGPVDGFQAQWSFPGQRISPKLIVDCTNPSDYSFVHVYAKPRTMLVSGVGPPLWLPAAG